MLRWLPAAALLLPSLLPVKAEPIDPIVVTATRTAHSAEVNLASVTVIDRAEIERSQAQSVEELLRGLPGLSLANNGGVGKVSSLFLRGSESDHLLVLIDGIRIGSATTGTAALHDLPVELIERIEIVRGPRSSLYGSEAIGGVIQLFTRKGKGETRVHGSVGAGSHKSYQTAAGLSGEAGRGHYNLQLSHSGTAGYDSCRGSVSGGCYTIEPDRDGYSNLSGTLRAGWRFSDAASVDLHWLESRGESDFDGGFVNRTETRQQTIGATLRLSPLEVWDLSLTAARHRDNSDNLKDGTFGSRFNSRRDMLSLQSDLPVGESGLLTLGADYQQEKVGGSTAYSVTERDNRALFAQIQLGFGNQELQLAARHDRNEQFGGRSTGSIAWGVALSEGLRLSASWGSAFKAPSFNELYYPDFGNPHLKPETSQTFEVGIAGEGRLGSWSVNAYQSRIENMIAFDSELFLPNNIAQAQIRGIEGQAQITLDQWQISTRLTLLDPRNRTATPQQDNLLPKRSAWGARIDLDRSLERWGWGATLHAEGARYEDLANRRPLGHYTTLDLRTEYRFSKPWRLQAKLSNLLGERYETSEFYRQPGRAFYLTLRYQP